MLKKIIFKTLVVYFLSINIIQAAESGGMPQLDPEFWFSQIFWLTITFGVLYLVLSKLILPKISDNLESRKSQILDNLELAEKQRNDSEAKLKEFDKIIVVWSPRRIQYIRALKRKNMTESKLKAIISNQMPQHQKKLQADLSIPSSLGIYETRKRILKWLIREF